MTKLFLEICRGFAIVYTLSYVFNFVVTIIKILLKRSNEAELLSLIPIYPLLISKTLQEDNEGCALLGIKATKAHKEDLEIKIDVILALMIILGIVYAIEEYGFY